MLHLDFEYIIKAPIEKIWNFYSSVDSLKILTPPNNHIHIQGIDSKIRKGATYNLEGKIHGISIKWQSRITEVNPPHCFVDFMEKGPFPYWRHVHEFKQVDGGTLIQDHIDYLPPIGLFGLIANALFIKHELIKLFTYRYQVTKKIFEPSGSSTLPRISYS